VTEADREPTPRVGLAAGRGVWVVVPTYNERENLARVTEAILDALPECNVLVVDDHSPDGTGALADTMAAANPRIEVLHRSRKEGLGIAYRDGFRRVLDKPGTIAVVQMDADLSHDPADLPRFAELGVACSVRTIGMRGESRLWRTVFAFSSTTTETMVAKSPSTRPQ